MTSPLLTFTPQRAGEIYRSSTLAEVMSSIESDLVVADATRELAAKVNTSVSRSEPISRWVRYREAYSPALVEYLLAEFPVPCDSYILDPMCGSGSTQVAAQRLGHPSIGLDVSPYAVAVSNVKTHPLNKESHTLLANQLRDDAPRANTSQLSENDSVLTGYFPPRNLRALIGIRSWIHTEFAARPRLQEFANVALLSTLEECSNRKKDGNGLATRPTKVDSPWQVFKDRVEVMLQDSAELVDEVIPSASYHMSALEIGSAIELADKLLGVQLGAVIFSPPYPNSFDYFESYKMELLFGQFYSPSELQSARANLIRNYRQSGISAPSDNQLLELLVDEVMARIPDKEAQTGVRDSRSRLLPNLLRGYFEDMQQFITHAFNVMPSGTRMHIVVDQSAYLGVAIPTDLLLGDIGRRVGFEFNQILVCRPARTSPQQVAQQPLLKQTLRESVVVLAKP